MTIFGITSSINVSQETIYGKRRGLLREYYVNRVIWQAYFSFIHTHTHTHTHTNNDYFSYTRTHERTNARAREPYEQLSWLSWYIDYARGWTIRGSISSQKRPDWVWDSLGLLRNGYRGSVLVCLGLKRLGFELTAASIWCRGWEWV